MRKQLKWYHGLLALALFAGVMWLEYHSFFTHINPIYTSTIGEVLFLLIAVAVVLIAHVKPRTVFPFKRLRLLSIVGSYLMWRGTLVIGMFLAELMIYLFPKLAVENDGVTQMMRSMPMWMALLIIALTPALCEEMLFRGTVMHSSYKLRIPALIILVNAVIFGAAHLSLVKIPTVTILGILLAYMTYKSDNMTYSMIIHFVNNASSVFATFFVFSLPGVPEQTQQAASAAAEIPSGMLGVMLCACSLSPLFIYIGNNLFRRGLRKDKGGPQVRFKKEWLLLLGSVGFLIFAIGMLIFARGLEGLIDFGTL